MKIKPISEKAKSVSKVSSRSHLGERVPRLRFLGFEGEWEVARIGELYSERSQRCTTPMELLSVTISEGVVPRADIEGKDNSSEDKSNYKVVHVGDMVYNTMRMWQGASGLSAYNGIVSPAYTILKDAAKFDHEFMASLFKTEWLINEFRKNSQGLTSDTWNLKYPQIAAIKVRLPSVQEQHHIATFLSLIDSRITAQRKIVEHLKKHKRGLVQDLFTGELSKLPRRRFGGFKDAWISRSFDEVFSFLKNNTLPRSEMTTAGGMIRNVHYGDVLIKYGDVLDCNRDQIPFLVSDKKSDDCRLLQDGDVVIADTAEDEAVGKTVELVGVANKLIESGLHTIACRPKIPFASRFLGYYLNSIAYRRQLLPLMQGIKVLSLSKSQLGKTQLLFPPDINEQKRIAELLTGIDAHIAVAQSHLDKMQSLKMGFLQQLFV